MSNTGLRTMLGLPPAIPIRTINTKRSRNICSIPAHADDIGVVIVHLLSRVSDACRTDAAVCYRSRLAGSPGDLLRLLCSGQARSKTGNTGCGASRCLLLRTCGVCPRASQSNEPRPCFQGAVPGGMLLSWDFGSVMRFEDSWR